MRPALGNSRLAGCERSVCTPPPTPCWHLPARALVQAVLRRPCCPVAQVGEHLLRELLFIHLEHPADKLQLAVQMMVKLYALVRGAARGRRARVRVRVRVYVYVCTRVFVSVFFLGGGGI